jgi:small-conductance mechanosensitive channel/CRP-like cAMP-binding protein
VSTLMRFAEASPFGWVGLAVAVVMLALLRVLLPARRYNWIRAPLAMFLLHLVLVLARTVLPSESVAQSYLSLTALFFLLACMGRSAFLLVIHSALARRFTRPMPQIFSDILQGFVYVVAVIITLRAAGVAPGSLLTTSALLTAVIGLSLQDTLGNMFAGLAIQAQRPFHVGDWIQFDQEPKHVGRVIEINWRATKVLTLDQVEVIVPNAVLAKAPIINYTKPTLASRRNVYVMASYDVPPYKVSRVALDAMKDVNGVLADPSPSVVVNEFTDRGIEYRVRYFSEDFRAREHLDGTVRERLWYSFNRAGIGIPMATRRVYTQEVNDVTQARQHDAEVAQRETALRYVDFLDALPPEARRKLAALSETRMYAQGEVVLRQGEVGAELFIVWHGEVAVTLTRGRESVEIARLGEGKFFGEMSLMTGEQRTATVKATEPVELIVVGKGAFQQILEDMPELASRISEVLAARREELGELAAAADQGDRISHHEHSGILLARIKEFFSL